MAETLHPHDSDPLRHALTALRTDVDTLQLRPAADVRARGEARTRHTRLVLAGGTAAVLVAAVLGTGALGGASQGLRPVAPATGSTPTATPSASTNPSTPSASSNPSTPSNPATPSAAPGDASVPMVPRDGAPAALFLPAAAWSGPDLNGGVATRWQEPFDPEGTVQNGLCDGDSAPDGEVALVQVADAVTSAPIAQQKLRVHPSAAAAEAAFRALQKGVEDCQARLDSTPDNNVTVAATQDRATPAVSGPGSVAVYRLDVGFKDGSTSGVEWWSLVWDGDRAISTVMVNEPPARTDGLTTMRRISAAVADHFAAVGERAGG